MGYFSPDRTVAQVSSEEPADASDMCSSIRSSVFESDEFRFRFAVTGPGDSADCVIPPPNRAAPFEKTELEAWPEASRMPRIATVFPGEARPEEMICCTRLELELSSDCSSANTLNAEMDCGGCTPVLSSWVCAS